MIRSDAALALLAAAAVFSACRQPAAVRAANRPGAGELYIPGYGPAPAPSEQTIPPGRTEQVLREEEFEAATDTEPFLSESQPLSTEGAAVSLDRGPVRSGPAVSTAAFHAQLVQDIVAARLAVTARKPAEPLKPMSEGSKRLLGPEGAAAPAPQPALPGAAPRLDIRDIPNVPQVGRQALALPAVDRAPLLREMPSEAPSISQFAGDLDSIMYSEMLLAGSYLIQIATASAFTTIFFEKSYYFTADIDLQADLRRAGAEDGLYWVRVAFIDLLNYQAPFSKPRVYNYTRRR